MASNPSLFRSILRAGLIAGTLDISAAIIQYLIVTGNNPVRILRYIAGAIFPPELVSNNPLMPVVGLLMHYSIAMTYTIFYFMIFPVIRPVAKHWILSGAVYGLMVWVVMNLVMVPMTRIGHRPFHLVNSLVGAGILVVCIGIPIAYYANRHNQNTAVSPDSKGLTGNQ